MAGFPTRVFDLTAEATDGAEREATGPTVRADEDGDARDGWYAPPVGRIWLIDTPRGVLLVTAEAFEGADLAPVVAEAEALLATLRLIDGDEL